MEGEAVLLPKPVQNCTIARLPRLGPDVFNQCWKIQVLPLTHVVHRPLNLIYAFVLYVH